MDEDENLSMLLAMGFPDIGEIRRSLRMAKNDINEAVAILTNDHQPLSNEIDMQDMSTSTGKNESDSLLSNMASTEFADDTSESDSTSCTDTSEYDFDDRIEKAVSSLVDVFPDTDLNFSRDDAVKYDGKQNKMLYWIQDIFDKDLARFFPTRKEQRCQRKQFIELNPIMQGYCLVKNQSQKMRQ